MTLHGTASRLAPPSPLIKVPLYLLQKRTKVLAQKTIRSAETTASVSPANKSTGPDTAGKHWEGGETGFLEQ